MVNALCMRRVKGLVGQITQKPHRGVQDLDAAFGETADLLGGALPWFAEGYILYPQDGQGCFQKVLETCEDGT
jgi:hypothetical protein